MRLYVVLGLLQLVGSAAQEAPSTALCSNGVNGVQTGDVCCSAGCGLCGGENCSSFGGLDATQCCTGDILSSGEVCSVKGAAPCIVDDVCDPNPCSPNESCTPVDFSFGYTCSCAKGFVDTGSGDERSCEALGVVSECSTGVPGIQNGLACCSSGCGDCGGNECHLLGGLGADDCCTSNILSAGELCSTKGSAPCMLCSTFTFGPCMVEDGAVVAAAGDPHMTGFSGQKFDFTGLDGAWYSLVSDLPTTHINMRVTTPVPSQPIITYITGVSLLTTDSDGLDHSIVISVRDPHSLESSCPAGVFPCLANGALSVVVDGTEALLGPGVVSVANDVKVSAVNLPGSCRSFGFENYWKTKTQEYTQQARALREADDMADWIVSDTTATNIEECAEYVTRQVTAEDEGRGGGLFAHQSEHALFKISTPWTTIRLSHGKLHQVAMRDPTDHFDLPDHLTWQMNIAVDPSSLSTESTGILGETTVPTLDTDGNPIMHGMEAIRGTQAEYRVAGPLEAGFVQRSHK